MGACPVLASLCVALMLRLFLSSERGVEPEGRGGGRHVLHCTASRFAWDAACWGVD